MFEVGFVQIDNKSIVITKIESRSELRHASCDTVRSSLVLVDLASIQIINKAVNLANINKVVDLQTIIDGWKTMSTILFVKGCKTMANLMVANLKTGDRPSSREGVINQVLDGGCCDSKGSL